MEQAYSQRQTAGLMGKLLSCSAFEQVADKVLKPVSSQIDARSSVFLQFFDMSFETNMVGRHSYVGERPRSVEVYADGYFHLDPVIQPSLQYLRARQNGEGALVTLLSALPNWRESDYYRNFLEPFDIGHVLALAIPVRTIFRREMLCLGFHRRHQDQPFNSREVGQLRGMVPVIQSVLSNLALKEALTVSEQLLDALAQEGSGHGFVLLNEDLEIENGNDHGLRHLGLAGTSEQRHGLTASESLGIVRQQLLGDTGGRRLAFRIPGPGGRTIDVEVRALPRKVGRLRYLILTSQSDLPSIEESCRRFGLSSRETDVATLAAMGQRNAEISVQLGISLRTVENHLRSIFEKASVSTRTQLASKLMQSGSSAAPTPSMS